MGDKLTPDQIKARIEAAFPPHITHAEVFDFEHRVRFQVRAQDRTTILATVPEWFVHDVEREQELEERLRACRPLVAEVANEKGVS